MAFTQITVIKAERHQCSEEVGGQRRERLLLTKGIWWPHG